MVYKKGYSRKGNSSMSYYQQGVKGGRAHRSRYSRTPFQQVQRDIGYLRGLINVEFKTADTEQNLSGTGVLEGGNVQLLNGLSRGDSGVQRDGDQVRFKSIESRLFYARNSVDATIRTIFFIDLQSDGVTPLMGEVIETANASPIVACRKLENRSRFLILKDVISRVSVQNPQAYVHFYRKLDLKTVYKGSSAQVDDIQSKGLFVLQVSMIPATNGPTCSSQHRLRFIDN